MSYYNLNHLQNKSDIDVDLAEAEEAAECHDAYLRKLVSDEYNAAVRFAKTMFDHEVRAASDLPPVEYMSAYLAADTKFLAAIAAARAAMPARLERLRANDEAEEAREMPRIYPEVSQRSVA